VSDIVNVTEILSGHVFISQNFVERCSFHEKEILNSSFSDIFCACRNIHIYGFFSFENTFSQLSKAIYIWIQSEQRVVSVILL